MRITIESNYAIRIVACMANAESLRCAKSISENTGITLRFALKILRKLSLAKIVRSYKGTKGGYKLTRKACNISFKDVIEAVDGPIDINRCENSMCNKAQNNESCEYYAVFADVSDMIRNKLSSITFERSNISIKKQSDIIKEH